MLIHPPTIDEERPNFPAQFAAVGGTTEVKRAKKFLHLVKLNKRNKKPQITIQEPEDKSVLRQVP